MPNDREVQFDDITGRDLLIVHCTDGSEQRGRFLEWRKSVNGKPDRFMVIRRGRDKAVVILNTRNVVWVERE